jgi:arginase
MKLFTIGTDAGKVAEQLKKFQLSESGVLLFFEIKEMKDSSSIELELGKSNGYCGVVGNSSDVTLSAFNAFSKHNPGAGIIAFSARPDVNALVELIENKALDKNNIVIVGSRSLDKDKKKFLDESKIKTYPMKEMSFEGIRVVADNVMSVARQWSKACISIDISVLDPAFAPGASHQEPGGMSTRDLLYFIQRLKMLRNIGMFDVTGFDLGKDLNGITAKTTAKIIAELS